MEARDVLKRPVITERSSEQMESKNTLSKLIHALTKHM